MMMWKGVIGTKAGLRENSDVSDRGSRCITAGSQPVMWHHPSDAMERSGGAESAPMCQMVNLNISNITVQARKAGLSFSGARLTPLPTQKLIHHSKFSGDPPQGTDPPTIMGLHAVKRVNLLYQQNKLGD
jgi:hypothetical protein